MISRSHIAPCARLVAKASSQASSPRTTTAFLRHLSSLRSYSYSPSASPRPTASSLSKRSIAPRASLLPQPTTTTRFLSTSTKAAIQSAVSSAPVVLFMKGTPETPQCGFSRASVQVLGMQGVDPSKFAAFNVLEDAELRSGIKEFSDWPTIPQVYVDGEFVGGCDILMSMHHNGELAKLLEEKGVLLMEEEGGKKAE